jgi:valyl-tRNA synthetase
MTLEKNYDAAATEARLYEKWEKSGAFACNVNATPKPYTIMMPPPNVTGSLHMGHALTFTLQDILVRFQRMRGRDVLWQPGTDHAGIATQMIVERQLAASGSNVSRREMGRAAFLDKIWEWKAQSGGTITRQLRRLGASCDWSRERFTMDPELNRAVTRAFVTLYKDKLIFKDKRLVNWDPKMLTAVSDLEVEQKELKSHMWHFRYPLENKPGEFICIATTRPETMLGDGAVAVNPKDERYKHLVGTYAVLPLANRRIPIIADEHADPEKGSGAVKITAAHDFNDFEVWKRHRHQPYFVSQQDGGLINLFDEHARMNENAPEAFRGLDRYAARKKVIADLEALDLIDKIENITHVVPHGDRSGVVIEPWLSEQWYCDAKTLAEPAIKAVEEGHTVFEPRQWTSTYFAWMRNIEPWCISRQLWWGHQIPAWYGPDGKVFVADSEAEAVAEATKHYGKTETLTRDEDVLDTWFSSALWPFSTLGWPDKTPELARYYPTDVLVTGFDIIFFWVARMMMMGLYFMKDVPFRTIYIHALVRDEKGQKMSKTKGNVIDPLDIIDTYGCDALRFTLANMSTPGRDIRLATSRIEGNRNFATKLWNAARFCQMNGCVWQNAFNPATVTQTVNQWIVGEVKLAADKIAGLLLDHRFDLSSSAAYDFCWNIVCDWYLEFTKPILTGSDEVAKAETQATTAWALGQMLYILHPFMPYITEELWDQFTGNPHMLISADWPVLNADLVNKAAKSEVDWVIALISNVRAVRSELNVPAGAQVPLQMKDASAESKERLTHHQTLIARLARLSGITHVNAAPKGAAQAVLGEATLILPLADIIDLEQERARLKKEGERLAAEIQKLDGKLGNKEFIDRAPPEIVAEQRERKAEAEAMLAKLEAAAKSLSA